MTKKREGREVSDLKEKKQSIPKDEFLTRYIGLGRGIRELGVFAGFIWGNQEGGF